MKKEYTLNNVKYKLEFQHKDNNVYMLEFLSEFDNDINNWETLLSSYSIRYTGEGKIEDMIGESMKSISPVAITDPYIVEKKDKNGNDCFVVEMFLRNDARQIIELTFQKWFKNKDNNISYNQYNVALPFDKVKDLEWLKKQSLELKDIVEDFVNLDIDGSDYFENTESEEELQDMIGDMMKNMKNAMEELKN